MTGRRRESARHGTPSGYNAHRRREEPPCDACYAAKSAYEARYREASEHVRAARLRARAQRRALTRLRRVYPVLYRLLYEEEKKLLEREDELTRSTSTDDAGRPA